MCMDLTGDVGKDGVGVVARAHSQACVDHPQKFKNLWINLGRRSYMNQGWTSIRYSVEFPSEQEVKMVLLDRSEGSHCLQYRDWSEELKIVSFQNEEGGR